MENIAHGIDVGHFEWIMKGSWMRHNCRDKILETKRNLRCVAGERVWKSPPTNYWFGMQMEN